MTEFLPKHVVDCNGHAASSILARVSAYWASLRRDRQIPSRTEIDAASLGEALPHIFLAEMVTPRVARIRFCGHKFESLMGMDMRGMPLSALFTGRAREELIDALAQVASGVRVSLAIEAERGFGLPPLTARLALLPLSDGAGRCNRILGVLETEGEIGRTPRRFALVQERVQQIVATPPVAQTPTLRVITGGLR